MRYLQTLTEVGDNQNATIASASARLDPAVSRGSRRDIPRGDP
jgi:hypothetical protein